jgi:hypothetical protein
MASVLVLAALGLTLPGCGRKAHGSPQEVFDAFKTAAAKEDYKGFTECLTNDSRKVLTGGMVFGVVMIRQFAGLAGKGAGDEAKMKPLEDALKKHGITDDFLKKVSADGPKLGDPVALKNAIMKMAEPVKDHGAFMADVVAATKQMGAKEDPSKKLMSFKTAELRDVKTSGDTATGTVVIRDGGAEKSEPIHFRKEEGGWRIDVTEMMMKKGP